MNLKRVLVAYSYEIDEKGSQRGALETYFALINSCIKQACPILKGKIEFYCCFILEDVRDEYISEKLFEGAVFGRISKAIKHYKPQIIILHTGFTFLMYPELILRVFSKLHKEFPELKFGYDKQFLHSSNSFSSELELLFKKNSTLFNESEEISVIEDLLSAKSVQSVHRIIEILKNIEDGYK